MPRRMPALLLAALTLCASPAWAATYQIDPAHSSISFKIRHLFTQVPGVFRDFAGTIDYVPGQPEQWKAATTIQAASIDTRVEKRDTHLRSADFFDVEKHSAITFRSTGVTDVTEHGGKLHGLLTLHGVEKPVVLDFTVLGEGKDPWGHQRAGFSATTTLDRREFGIVWNEKLETGGVLLGDAVQVTLELEGVVK